MREQVEVLKNLMKIGGFNTIHMLPVKYEIRCYRVSIGMRLNRGGGFGNFLRGFVH